MSNKEKQKATNKTNPVLPTIKVDNQTQLKAVDEFNGALVQLMPVKAIKNEVDAELVFNTADTLDGKIDFIKAKVLDKVNIEKWYEKSGYKSIVSYAQAKHNIAKVMTYNYIKASQYIDEDGKATLFDIPNRGIKDFSITVLAEVFAPSGLSFDEINELIKGNKITVAMSKNDIKKVLKKLNAVDIDEGAETSTEGAETSTEGAETSTEGAETLEKVETIEISFNPKTAENAEIAHNGKRAVMEIPKHELPQSAYIVIVYNGQVTKVYQNKGNTAE